ncbi:MAG: type II secretion system F family protein [Lachnospiraceae bacterium]|nr:type II secretion system F family protein [Lachnospiraceae bacterium]
MAKFKQLSNEELAAFCSQISILLKGGVPVSESIRTLLADTEDKELKALLENILKSLSEGNRMADSLRETGAFPEYVLTTIRLGEEAGSMDSVFASLADFYERETQIKENITGALAYPLIMIFLMIVVIVVLVTKVLPIFNQVFIQLGSEMSGFAASLLNFGNALSRYGMIITVVLVLLIVAYFIFSRTRKGRKLSQKMLSGFPLTKKLYEDIAVGRFASGLSLARGAGLDTFIGIDLVSDLVENKAVLEKIRIVKEALKEGDNLAEALKRAEMFSNVNNRLIVVGIKTGDDDAVLNRIADEYSKKSERKMNTIISIIEPTLVIILSVIVGLILLSVILPLMGIMSNIG